MEYEMIKFKGYNWKIKNRFGGPGPNKFSKDNVRLIDGSLVLSVKNGTCAEITLDKELGYGKYTFTIEKPFLHRNIVLGLFTYLDDLNEIDIEFSRWGRFLNKNLQYVVQPNVFKRLFSFRKKIIVSIEWRKNYVEWVYNNKKFRKETKTPKMGKIHVNLWLLKKININQKVKLIDFKFEK